MLRGITPKSVLEHLLFAVIGGVMYMLIEIAWRGYTHWSMGILGGVCFVLVGLLNEIQQRPPIILQMAQGAVICTVLELLAGLVLSGSVWIFGTTPACPAISWGRCARSLCLHGRHCRRWPSGLRTDYTRSLTNRQKT